jgi:hyaluronan synthase
MIAKQIVVFFFVASLSCASFIISFYKFFSVSVYGIFIALYFLIQTCTALLNRRNIERTDASKTNATVTILVVGYREDRDYWKKCLESIKNQEYPWIQRVILSIDGNEPEDQYMADIAHEVFGGGVGGGGGTGTEGAMVNISLLSPVEEEPLHYTVLRNNHGGKRHAMCQGLEEMKCWHGEEDVMALSKYVVFMDSDTVLTPSATTHLVTCVDASEENGCATGSLLIFDHHFLGRIINARYAYAFNIERASLSYFGVMNCCSGPFSIYRTDTILKEGFLQEFRDQSFLGVQCGPGDDRHLTNMFLTRGLRSRQTHLALAYTEAPKSFTRFLKQQTRWMRSFFREQYWQVMAISKQNAFLGVVTQYEILYPVFVMTWLIRLIFLHSLSQLLLITGFTTGIIIIRTLLLCFLMRSIVFVYNIFYLPIYMVFLLPLKIYCLLTVREMGWITSSRLNISNRCDLELGVIIGVFLLWLGSIGLSVWNKMGFVHHNFVFPQNI